MKEIRYCLPESPASEDIHCSFHVYVLFSVHRLRLKANGINGFRILGSGVFWGISIADVNCTGVNMRVKFLSDTITAIVRIEPNAAEHEIGFRDTPCCPEWFLCLCKPFINTTTKKYFAKSALRKLVLLAIYFQKDIRAKKVATIGRFRGDNADVQHLDREQTFSRCS